MEANNAKENHTDQEPSRPRSFHAQLNEAISGGSLDFYSWKSLISEIEKVSPDNIDLISLAYDSFLAIFPLCHWYWKQYAYLKAKLCGSLEAVKTFERGVEAATFSVALWVEYFRFGTLFFKDPSDVRSIFARGLSCVEKDYFCHALWDEYMQYEFKQEGWSFLAQSYVQVLKSPTKKLDFYYDNFKKFVANLEEEIGYADKYCTEVEKGYVPSGTCKTTREEISCVVKDLLDSSDISLKLKALNRYKYLGNKFYQDACLLDEKVKFFETNIQRRYFYVTPLDDDQLNNWHHYLDFVESLDNFDWAMKLYERCLISCANYPEFWIRYVEFLESKNARELAISTLNRATDIFLKNVPEIQLFSARFKEQIGDEDGAYAALKIIENLVPETDSSFIQNVITQSNLEKRLGNLEAASATYKKALKVAAEKQNLHVLPSLYSNYARLTLVITGSADAARDVIIDGIRHLPNCKFLLEELINFAMSHGASQVGVVDSIVANAISAKSVETEGLNAKDREDISTLFLKFADLCGTVNDVRKAWKRHVRLFPQFTRVRAARKHFRPSSYLIDVVREQSQDCNLIEPILPSENSNHGHGFLQERVSVVPKDHETHLEQDLEEQLGQQDDYRVKGKRQKLSPSVRTVSKENSSQENVSAHYLEHHSGDPSSGPVDSTSDLISQPRKDKPEAMDVTDERVNQANECGLDPHESAHQLGKSSKPSNLIQESDGDSGAGNVRPDMDCNQLKQVKVPASLTDSELIPMSSKVCEATKGVSVSGGSTVQDLPNVDFHSFPSPKSISIANSPQPEYKSEIESLMCHPNDTPVRVSSDPEVLSRTKEGAIQKDPVPVTADTSLKFKGNAEKKGKQLLQSSSQDSQHDHPASEADAKMFVNPSNPNQLSVQRTGSIIENTGAEPAHVVSMSGLSSSTSAKQPALSSPSVSHPHQNMLQHNFQSSPQPGDTQYSQARNQMLQYHYQQQQQQMLQPQSHSQQLQMQQSYVQSQYGQQSAQPQQQQNQQHYAQQMQQSHFSPYQLQQQMAYFQPSQQQLQQYYQQNQQLGQGQQLQLQYQQAYHMQPQGYQQEAQGQVLQQYQLYQQGYQYYQQQPQQGYHQQYRHQQDELQQNRQVEPNHNLTHGMSHHQQGQEISQPDHHSASQPPESPLLQGQAQ